jgi:hypothetical protein
MKQQGIPFRSERMRHTSIEMHVDGMMHKRRRTHKIHKKNERSVTESLSERHKTHSGASVP